MLWAGQLQAGTLARSWPIQRCILTASEKNIWPVLGRSGLYLLPLRPPRPPMPPIPPIFFLLSKLAKSLLPYFPLFPKAPNPEDPPPPFFCFMNW
eukprot:Skav203885  [mRNA]  locus=scaffold1649:91680:93285:- [translate_table: standard]